MYAPTLEDDVIGAAESGQVPGIPVLGQEVPKLGDIHLVAHEDGKAQAAGHGESVPALHGDPNRRMRFLVGLGDQVDVMELVELALVREGFLAPGLEDDFQGLGEAAAAFGVVDVVPLVGLQERTAADTEDEPALADMVNDCGFFGDAEGVGQGKDLDGQTDLDPFGPCCDGAGPNKRGSHDSALGPEVGLPDPEGVQPQVLRGPDHLEPLPERLGLVAVLTDGEHGEDAEVHGWPAFPVGLVNQWMAPCGAAELETNLPQAPQFSACGF